MLNHVPSHPLKSPSAPSPNSWMSLLVSQNPGHFTRDTLADVTANLVQAVNPLLEDTTLYLVLELQDVEYVSSSVLQFLMEAQDRIKKKGGCTERRRLYRGIMNGR